MSRFFPSLIAVICALLTTGCSGIFKHKVDFNASEPIRVAVLPFYHVNEKNELIEVDGKYLIDEVEFVSSGLNSTPATFVRNLVQNDLAKSGLDLVSPALVDANLSHNGFDKLESNPPFDLQKIRSTKASEFCSKLFSCDAVLYGKITRWSRSYYGIQTVASVGIDLELISASDDKIIFSSSGEDSDSRGITKGPTGFSDLVIEPLKGLDNEIIVNLAKKTVAQMLIPLRVENRPEFLESSPPAIFASAHDAPAGQLSRNDVLTVVVLGSGKQSAAFSIGSTIENIPMIEKDSGHYLGKYFPLSSDKFKNQSVYVTLTDKYGRSTKQKIGTSSVTLE